MPAADEIYDLIDRFIEMKVPLKLVFATNNINKFREIKDVAGENIDLLSLNDIGFSGEIPEDFNTLEENAAQKAFHIYERYNANCFADDTGLEIEALNNEPGVFSARYAGENCTYDDNVNKVLLKLEGIEQRNAKFRTVIALVLEGRLFVFSGEIKGTIATGKRGNNGFGYDPVFIPSGYQKTFAEMSPEEKNFISHRTLALNKLVSFFRERGY